MVARTEFQVPPINVPTLSPLIAFAMFPGSERLKTTTAKKNHKTRNNLVGFSSDDR